MKKILCIGELLIDFICSDIDNSLIEGTNFIKKAGGAPANVTAAISKLGGSATFGGSVGADAFGLFLKKTLDDVAVDTSLLKVLEKQNTTLAFVSLKENGERDFIFNRGADENFCLSDKEYQLLNDYEIVHFGSATALLGGELKETYLKSMMKAKELNLFISFDPNYRVDLWKGRDNEFIDAAKECLKYADFVKVSDEEAKILTGKEDLKEAAKDLCVWGAKTVAITLGKEGTMITDGTNLEIIQSIKIKSIDSTGAGDAFVGATLYKLSLEESSKEVVRTFSNFKKIIQFGNIVGAIVCTKLGAIAAIPTLDEVRSFIEE
ncbi:carbohydrate kinase family protein [Clostridium cellulovorans]|uniref:PfkB domain protein n=1 Tax=Clostridium cellulovorans (strain ATCC 35296 / DSM 3052 / OCM 3 / 743B) TaxID=573061 RepID=D9SNF7_CLOC7|nr:carbohydrate kinase [Clostridium cellulovorans]ADL53949.1 PfkB domain protein [Clostridium cellulovorans 743B]